MKVYKTASDNTMSGLDGEFLVDKMATVKIFATLPEAKAYCDSVHLMPGKDESLEWTEPTEHEELSGRKITFYEAGGYGSDDFFRIEEIEL